MTSQARAELKEETGAVESEIMEFTIGDQLFGIDVSQVREIMTAEPVKPMQKSNMYVEGIYKPRDKVITVINLSLFLELGASDKPERDIYIITDFKDGSYAFHVHTVVGIDRISGAELKKPDPVIYGGREGVATGIVEHSGKLITILNFESIIAGICPDGEI